jgi:hypothetical protein
LLLLLQVWHVAFGVWAFSLFGVAESRLVTPSFSGLVHTVCTGLARVLEATSSVTAEQAAARLLGANAAHLLIALFVLAGVVCLKLTLMLWIRVRPEGGWPWPNSLRALAGRLALVLAWVPPTPANKVA